MIFLPDEMLPRNMLAMLRRHKHVGYLLSDLKKTGISNGAVANLAIQLDAVIITCDSDFLSLNRDLQKKSSIIYLKIHPRDPIVLVRRLEEVLDLIVEQGSQPGKTVITNSDYRHDSVDEELDGPE